jgi:SAM-dependent methyltransferase
MAQFDAHVESYREAVQQSIAFGGQDLEFFHRRKANQLIDVVSRRLGDPEQLSALDVGCGVGLMDTLLEARLGGLCGVDTSGMSVAHSSARNGSVRYCAADGTGLPFATAGFDLAFAVCVVHHVPSDRRGAFMAELRRVVRPGGLVVIFEHNPYNPVTRLAVSRCEFDEDAELVTRRATARLLNEAGLLPVEARDIIFTTSSHPWARRLDDALGWVPFGAQHYVAALR